MDHLKLVQVDSVSLEQFLLTLSGRVAVVEEAISLNPAYSVIAERIAQVENKIASLQYSLPPSFSEVVKPQADEGRITICLDELRTSQMKLQLDHALNLHLEIEKLKRLFVAIPSEADQDVWKQCLLSEMADATLKSKASIVAVEQSTSEKLASHNVEFAQWQCTFESAIGKRLDGVVDLINEQAKSINDVAIMTNERLASHEEGLTIVEQTTQLLRDTASKIDDDKSSFNDRISNVERSIDQVVKRLGDIKYAMENQSQQLQTAFTTMANMEMSVLKRCESLEVKIDNTDVLIRGHRRQTDIHVQEIKNTFNDYKTIMDAESARLNLSNSLLTELQTQLGRAVTRINSHDISLESLAKLDTMILQHHARFGQLDRTIEITSEKHEYRFSKLENEHTALRHHVSESEWVHNENNKQINDQLTKLCEVTQTTQTAVGQLSKELPELQFEANEVGDKVVALQNQVEKVSANSSQVEVQLHEMQHHITDWRGAMHVRFDTYDKEQSAMLDQATFRVDEESKLTLKNFKAMHHLVDSILQKDVINPTVFEERITKWSKEIAELELQQEHFRSHSTVLPDELKQKIASLILQATYLLSNDVRHQINQQVLSEHNVDDNTLQSIRNKAANMFAIRVRRDIDTISPPSNHFLQDARDTFERRVRNCVETTLSFVGASFLTSRGKRPSNTATCISCDRPIFDAEPINGPTNQDEDVDTKKASKSRPSTAGKIDVRSVIPRRSGSSSMKPKTSADIVHVPPNATNNGEQFIYRGGFRLPKSKSIAEVDVNMAIRHVEVNFTEKLHEEPCLEKVSLRGRHEVY
ncbi:hypothetical protein THRCLA_03562 [Thraustotheca clavata]|uniref:Uncharacterized protein n=1 Tax=Thraustotheca clavata TaxID=74557 RepID=A0A1W0A1Q1_9STRA|nr:hypothetical protein THRCLA_03562 [Thraustotheca clavata]